ncbi:MAG: HYR domain-containing protein [Phycisphaerales bacterium]
MFPVRSRRNAFIVAASILVPALSAATAGAAVKTWDGGAGTQLWSDAANWSPDGVPGPGDDAIIDVAGSITVTINSAVTVSSLTCAETLVMNGNLTIGAASTISGAFNWNGGTLSGSAPLLVSGTATLASGSTKVLDRMTLSISGAGSWDGAGGFTFTDSGTSTKSFLEILDGGTFTLPTNDTGFGVSGPGHALNNFGTLIKPGAGTFTCAISLNNSKTITVAGGSLDITGGGTNDGAYTVTAGQCRFLSSQTHSATAVLSGNNRFTGGVQTLLPGVTINNITMEGATVTNAANVTIGGTVNWTAGTITGDGSLEFDGAISLTGGSTKTLDRKTIKIGGSGSWDGAGGFTFTDSGTSTKSFLEILNGASFTLPSNSTSFGVSGPGHALNNFGALIKPGGGTFTCAITLNNSKTITVAGGSLDITGGGSCTGLYDAAGQCRFLASHTFDTGTILSGDIHFTGGTQTLKPNITAINHVTFDGATVVNTFPNFAIAGTVQWTAGTLTGNAPLVFNGVISLTGGSTKTLDRKTIKIGGSGSWDGAGGFTFTDSGTGISSSLEILDGGTFTLPSNSTAFGVAGTGHALNNFGTLIKPGAGTFTCAITLNNSSISSSFGEVIVSGGSFDITGGGTNDGAYTVTAGQCRFLSSQTHSATAVLSGNNRFTGGVQTLLPGVTINNITMEGATVTNAANVIIGGAVNWTAGTITGDGTLEFDGLISLTGGSTKTLDRKTIKIGNTGSWDGAGGFTFTDSGTSTKSFLEILAGASFTLPSNSTSFGAAGFGHAVNNFGTLIKPGAGTTFTQPIPLNNKIGGLVAVQDGSLDITGGGTNDGEYNVTAGQCRFLSSQTHSATAVLSGNNRFTGGVQTLLPGVTINNITMEGATVTNAANVIIGGAVNWTAGTITGDGTLEFDGLISLTGGSTKTLDRKTIKIGNTGSWDGAGGFTFTDSGTSTKSFLEILDGGTFTLPSNNTAFGVTGTGHAVNNAGTLIKPGVGSFSHGVALNNSGTVTVNGGTMQVPNGFTQTAGSTVLNGGTLANNGPAMALQGGVVKGNGSSTGATSQAGGSIAPGFSPGTISMGSLTQNAASVLDLELGGTSPGTQFDQVVVSGTATLAGTLRLTFINGFVPHTGDSFVVVNAASRSGTFSAVDVTNFPDCVVFVTYTATQAIVKIETTPPVALCHAIDVNLSPAGVASVAAAQIDAGSSDNCQIESIVVAPNSFTCSDLGPNVVTLTVTDLVGNVATCQSIVTVHDVTAPVIAQMPRNLGVQCASLIPVPNTNDVVANDACGPVTITWQGDAPNGGAGCPGSPLVITRTYRATDGSGNFSELAQSITVVDSTAPTIVAFPRDQSLHCIAEVPPADVSLVSATENCGGTPTITHVGDASNGGAGCPTSPLVISRTYRATDTCGNAVDHIQTFTIVNDIAPTITAFPRDGAYQCAAEIPAADVSLVSATGTCDGSVRITVAADLDNGGSGCAASPLVVTRTYTATDGCGNATSRSQVFTVIDTTAPSFVDFPRDQSLQCRADVPAPEDERVTAIDNCSATVTVTHEGDVDNGGAGCSASPLVITRTYRAADSCGNVVDAVQVITVIDDAPPTIASCAADVTIEQGCDTEVLPDLTATLTVDEHCGAATIEQSPSAGTRLDVGKHVVTFTLHDACGNVATCQSTYTVVAAACPADLSHDSAVAADDLAILLGAWGSCSGCCADLNSSGEVDALDLAILLGAWGPCPSGAPDANSGTGAGDPAATDAQGTALAAAGGAAKRAGAPTSSDASEVAPEADPAPTRVVFIDSADGVLVIEGDLHLAPTDRVVIHVRSTEPIVGCDLIVVTGTATLDGTLDLVLDDAFDGEGLPALPVIVAKQLSGEFATIETNLDAERAVSAIASGSVLSLEFAGAEQAAPAADEPRAFDINGDGVVDVFDLLVVLRGGQPNRDAVAFIRCLASDRAKPD